MKIIWDKYNRGFVELEDSDCRSVELEDSDCRSFTWIKENVSSLPQIPSNTRRDYFNKYMKSCSKYSFEFIASNLINKELVI